MKFIEILRKKILKYLMKIWRIFQKEFNIDKSKGNEFFMNKLK